MSGSDDDANRRMQEHIDRVMRETTERVERDRLEQQRLQREEQKRVQDARRAEFAKLPTEKRLEVIREHMERTGISPDLAQVRYLMELGRGESDAPGRSGPEPDRNPHRAQQERGKDPRYKGQDRGPER
jgi:hypothetical protein